MASIALGDHEGATSNGDAGKVADERCALLDMLPEDVVCESLHRAIPGAIVAQDYDEHQMLRNLTLTCKTFKDALKNHHAWTDLTHYYCATMGFDTGDERCYEVLIAKIREHYKITRDVHIVMGRVISERYFPVLQRDVEDAIQRVWNTAAKGMLIMNPDDEESFVNYVFCEHWGDAIIIDSQKRKRGEPVATVPTSEMIIHFMWSEMIPIRASFVEEEVYFMRELLIAEFAEFSVFHSLENSICKIPLMPMLVDTNAPLRVIRFIYQFRWVLPRSHPGKKQIASASRFLGLFF